MSFNPKKDTIQETDNLLLFFQTHLIHIDLLTNPIFQRSHKLTPDQALDRISYFNTIVYTEFEHLFILSKEQMIEIVNDRFGIKLPEVMIYRTDKDL